MKDNIFFYLFLTTYLFIILEYFFSVYKKDGVYSFYGVLGNLTRGVFLQFFSYSIIMSYLYLLATKFDFFYKKIILSRELSFSITHFLFALVLVDFCWYIFHRTNHITPFLRNLHRTHHGDDRFNLSTAFRVSWIEQTYILLFFLPALFLVDLKSAYWAFFSFNFYQFFVHSQYIKIPKFLDLVLITPALHKAHHGQLREEQNSNFGGIFSFWDRIFGTYKKGDENSLIGIKNYHQNNFIKMETDHIL